MLMYADVCTEGSACRSPYVWIRQHTSGYASIRQRMHGRQCLSLALPQLRQHFYFCTRKASKVSASLNYFCWRSARVREHTSAYVSIRQHTSAYVSIRQHTLAYARVREYTSVYVSIRQDTSGYVRIRQHTHLSQPLPPARHQRPRARGGS
jgi:hypothetical protein